MLYTSRQRLQHWRALCAHAAALFIALTLANCSPSLNFDRPKPTRVAEPAMPTYPGAQEVRLETFAITNVGTGYVRTFSTPDAPAMVAAFYERELVARGWRKVANNDYVETRACPTYEALLETDRTSEGVAHVRLTWQPEECKKI